MFENLFAKGGLSLERLRSFMQMAHAGSIAKAAPQNATRQSLISRQIRELEEFFGTELTQRRGKTLSLSVAGERLAALIREQLQDLEDFRNEQDGAAKAFTISAGGSTLEWLVTRHLAELAAALGNAILRTEAHRSRPLAEAVSDGRVDFAILREDAIPQVSAKNSRRLVNLTFHLCVPRGLLKRGTTAAMLRETKRWCDLPFAAGRDGGQMDTAVREGMKKAAVDFKPRFECGSMLQVRQLVEQGICASVLPNIGMAGLGGKNVLSIPFAPLAGYGRVLALHWNPRQMRRRGVDDRVIEKMTRLLRQF